MGSFMRLTAVYSDMPCESSQWHGVKNDDAMPELVTYAKTPVPTGAIFQRPDSCFAPKNVLHIIMRKKAKSHFQNGSTLNGTTAS